MKYAVALAAMSAVAAAKPLFLNSAFVVEEGQPFQIKMSGCDSGCTLELDNGDPKDLKTYKTLSTDATGNEITVTLTDIPSDTYAFRLTDNATGEYNFSEAFEYEGTGPATTSASASSTSVSTTTSSSTPSTTSMTSSSSTLITTTTSNTTTVASTTTSTSRTSSVMSSTSATTSPTDVPGAAGRLASPLALVAGAVAAMLIFN